MGTPTFYINDVFIAGDEAAKWNEEQWRGVINKVLPAGENSVDYVHFIGIRSKLNIKINGFI